MAMNARIHTIIGEFLDVLIHQTINKELNWESHIEESDIKYSLRHDDGEVPMFSVSYGLCTSIVDMAIYGEHIKTSKKEIVDKINLLFSIINYDKKDNILSDQTIKFMRKYVDAHK